MQDSKANANTKKTKEMIISPSNSNVFSPVKVDDIEIERVDVFKLLGCLY